MAPEESSQKKPYQLTENLAGELSLREGQLLRARVVSCFSEDEGKLLIELKGRRVVARSHLDVEEDQVLLVRVQSLEHPIELRLFEPTDASQELSEKDLRTYLSNRQIDDSDESVEFLRNWLEESLPLDDERFRNALDNRSMIESDDPESTRDNMWAFCFLEERDLPVGSESLELLGTMRDVSGDGETWTRFFADNAGSLELGTGGMDVEGSVDFVGFDLINRLGKRPREASRTLHAMLLKEWKNGDSDLNVPPGRLETLLGRILGVALVNLGNPEEFLFFVPMLQGGRVEPAWVGGRLKTGGSAGWYLNAYLTLSNLGTVGVTVERSPSSLRLTLSVGDENIAEFLKNNRTDLESRLSDENCSVTVNVRTEDPKSDFDAFDLAGTAGTRPFASFSKGLDLTV